MEAGQRVKLKECSCIWDNQSRIRWLIRLRRFHEKGLGPYGSLPPRVTLKEDRRTGGVPLLARGSRRTFDRNAFADQSIERHAPKKPAVTHWPRDFVPAHAPRGRLRAALGDLRGGA